MPDSKINGLMDNLVKILNKDSEDIADVLNILSNYEKAELQSLFTDAKASNGNLRISEAALKAEAVSSLIYVVQNNPQLSDIVNNLKGSTDKEHIIKRLSNIAFELYQGQYQFGFPENYTEQLALLTLMVFYAVTADKQTIADIVVSNSIENFKHSIAMETSMITKLQASVYRVLLAVVCRIKDRNELQNIERFIKETEELLQQIQNEELNREQFNLDDAIKISGLAIIFHIAKSVKHYLFTGKVQEESDADIYSYIETYSYNAIKLLKGIGDKKLLRITNQMKYTFQQVCRNSIWAIADKNPKIKSFFEYCLNSKDYLLYSLLPSQRDCILDILTTKKSIVLNMPTSSGKTLLAELYILFIMHNYSSGNESPTICYIVPTNALINQVCRGLKNDFSEFGFNIETVLPFYDIDQIEEEILTSKRIDILVSTPEKLDLLIRKQHRSLKNLRLVILDEAHNLGDETRGSKFELLLATIKNRRRNVNFLLLSPFMQNTKNISKWLGDTEQDSVSISLDWSPTKQYIGCNVLKREKTESYVVYFPSDRNNIVKEPIEVNLELNPQEVKTMVGENRIGYTKSIILIEKYINLGTVLVVCEGPGASEKLAALSVDYFKNKKGLDYIGDHSDIRRVIELIKLETFEDDALIKCLEYGIVYHHARLSALIKDEVEKLISKKELIKVVCATTTLAQGMNFPITTVIFDTLKFGSGVKMREIREVEFWNIAGRAGRTYMDKEGHIITPYVLSQSATKNVALKYIEYSLKEIISSLNDFFEKLNADFSFNNALVKSHPAASNFLQYLNHIVKVAHDYKIDTIDINKIRNMLNSSLFYKELSFKRGFLESQDKINNFVFSYIRHLKGENVGTLKLADLFGVSNISYKRVQALVAEYREQILSIHGEAKKEEYMSATKIILQTQNTDNLSKIIEIISKIPEIKIELMGTGILNSESIAKIVIGWVNGRKVNEIAKDILYEGANYKEVLGKCFQYVNSTMKSFMPWGISLYQNIAGDTKNAKAVNLPSYIYYGVNDDEAVILAKAGVPRFAIDNVKKALKGQNPELDINVKNIEAVRERIKNIGADNYKSIGGDSAQIKNIVESYL